MKIKNRKSLKICCVFFAVVALSYGGFIYARQGLVSNEMFSLSQRKWHSHLSTFSDTPIPRSSPFFKHVTLYNIDIPASAKLYSGFFTSSNIRHVGYLIELPNPKGVVVVLHGYLTHSLTNGHLITKLLRGGYSVAFYDMFGHGLSNGRPGEVENFALYRTSLLDFSNLIQVDKYQTSAVVGHSTGCVPIFDDILSGEFKFDKGVLLAPLVRIPGWNSSYYGAAFADLFIDVIPRKFRSNSSNREFMKFARIDPLQVRTISLAWTKALHRWEATIAERKTSNRTLYVLQGDIDTTVDFRYNMPLIKEKIPHVQIDIVAGGSHELLNELPKMRDMVCEKVLIYIEK